MIEKISIACPNCRTRVRMPTSVSPGRKPKCPVCKVVIYPEDVLPPELLPKDPTPPASAKPSTANVAGPAEATPPESRPKANPVPNPRTPPPAPPNVSTLPQAVHPAFASTQLKAAAGPNDETPHVEAGDQSPAEFAAKIAEMSRRGKLPTIPGFKILAQLGQGGMGVVYHVEQIGLKRQAALKMIVGGQYTNANTKARFLIEAEAIAKLRHANVLQVYGFGEHEGLPYLILEYVEGATLGHKIQREKVLSEDAAVAVLVGIADGVAHAHSKEIVHRDLKPVNILLTKDGLPKVADFGLARLANQELTSTGALLGTPSYMAPEQAAGNIHDVGPPSDVYSLGAILFEMLAGRPPFQGRSPFDILHKVLTEEPPALRSLAPRASRDLETVCIKCLAKDPKARYATAKDLADDLRRWQAGEPILGRRVSVVKRTWKTLKRNKPTAIAASAVLAAAAVVLGMVFFAPKPGPTPPGPEPVAQAPADDKDQFDAFIERGTKLLNEGDSAGSLLWFAKADAASKSADPGRVEVNKVRINALRSRATPLAHRFKHAATVTATEFSPDGRTLLTASEDRTAVVRDLATGQELARAELTEPVTFATFSPDGKKFAAVTKGRNAFVYDAATGKRIAGPLYHPVSVNVAAFSPDGTILATGGGSVLYQTTVTVTRPKQVKKMQMVTTYESVQKDEQVKNGDAIETRTIRVQVPVTRQVEVTSIEHVSVHEPVTQQRGEREPNYNRDGGIVRFWNVATGQVAVPEIAVADNVNRLAFAPDGQVLAVGLDTYNVAVGAPATPVMPKGEKPAERGPVPAVMPKPGDPAPTKPVDPQPKKLSSRSDFKGVPTDATYVALRVPRDPADPNKLPDDAPSPTPQPPPGPAVTTQPVAPVATSQLPGAPVQFWDIRGQQPRLLGGLPSPTRPIPAPPVVDTNAKPKPIPGRVSHLSFNALGHAYAVVDSALFKVVSQNAQQYTELGFLQYYITSAQVDLDAASNGFSTLTAVRNGKADLVTVSPVAVAMPAPAATPAVTPPAPNTAVAPAQPVAAPAPAVAVPAAPALGISVTLPVPADVEVLDAIPFGWFILTSSSDNRLRLWNRHSPMESQAECEQIVLPVGIVGVAADPVGRYFAAATADFRVSVWDSYGIDVQPPDDVVTDSIANQFPNGPPSRELALTWDGKYAYTRTSFQTLQAWDLATGKSVIDGGPNDGVQAAAMSGATLAASRNGRIEVYTVGRSDPVARFETADFNFNNGCLHVSGDGKKVFAHANYGTTIPCLIGDASGGTPVRWSEPTAIKSVAFSRDGTRLYLSCADGKVRVRDAATGKPADFIEIETNQAGSLTTALSPDGTQLLAAGSGKQLQVWNLATGQPVSIKPTELASVMTNFLTFSPDGKWLVAAGHDLQVQANVSPKASLQMWEWPTLTPIGPTVVLSGVPFLPLFSPDGKYLLTRTSRFGGPVGGNYVGPVTARLWDAATLAPVVPWQVGYESDVQFGPKGELLGVQQTPRNRVVRRVEFPPAKQPPEELRQLAQFVSGRDINSTFDVVFLDAAALDERLAKWRQEHANPAPKIEQMLTNELIESLEAAVASAAWANAAPQAKRLAIDAPDNPAVWPLVGDVRAAHADWSGATAAFEKAIQLKPDEPKLRAKLALVRLAVNDHKGAAAALASVGNDPKRLPFAKTLLTLLPGTDRAELLKINAAPTTTLTAPNDAYHELYGFNHGRTSSAVFHLLLDQQADTAIALEKQYNVTPAELYLAAAGHRMKGNSSAAQAAESRAEQLMLSTPSYPAHGGWEHRVFAAVVRERFRPEAPVTSPKQ